MGFSKNTATRGLRYPGVFLNGKKYPGKPRRGIYWIGPMFSTSAGFSPAQDTQTVSSLWTLFISSCLIWSWRSAGIKSGRFFVSLKYCGNHPKIWNKYQILYYISLSFSLSFSIVFAILNIKFILKKGKIGCNLLNFWKLIFSFFLRKKQSYKNTETNNKILKFIKNYIYLNISFIISNYIHYP